MNLLSSIFVLIIWFCLLPYVGSRLLQYIAPDAVSKVSRDEFWLVGFGVGQIALVKVLTIISLYGGLHQSSMTLTLAALLLLVIGANYFKGRGDLQYCFIMNDYYSMFQSLKDKFKERDIYLLIVLFVSLLLLVVDYNPIRHADALRYHIEYSNFIHETGSIPFVPHNQLALAQDAEVLFSLVHYWFGDEYVKLIIYVNFVFSLLVLYGVYGFYGKDVQKYAVYCIVTNPVLGILYCQAGCNTALLFFIFFIYSSQGFS